MRDQRHPNESEFGSQLSEADRQASHSPDKRPTLISVDEACRELGISRSTLYQLFGSGELTSVRVRGRRLIPFAAIEEMVKAKVHECLEANRVLPKGYDARGGHSW